MDLIAEFVKLPMPPTVNKIYANVGRKRIASSHLREFKKNIMVWGCSNREELSIARGKIRSVLDRSYDISLKFTFYFPKNRIYTKEHLIRKLDTSNRIKPAEDAICKLLDFDDRYVFDIQATKETGMNEEFSVKVLASDIKF
jgi:Holliday junction resolvase RusA-like endonuclease